MEDPEVLSGYGSSIGRADPNSVKDQLSTPATARKQRKVTHIMAVLLLSNIMRQNHLPNDRCLPLLRENLMLRNRKIAQPLLKRLPATLEHILRLLIILITLCVQLVLAGAEHLRNKSE